MIFLLKIAVLLICLKVIGLISASWWLILSPIWAPVVIVLLLIGFFFGIILIGK